MRRPRLGQQQRDLLATMANPSMMLVTPDRTSAALVRHGYLRSSGGEDGSCCITPAGLRALAEEMLAGRLKDAFQIAEERRAKAGEKT